MELESIIEQIEKLDVLGFPILAGIDVLNMRQERTKKESVNYIKEKEIVIGFSKHSSTVEEAYLKSCKGYTGKINSRNFTLYFDIKDAEITAHSSHFYWNGSPE